MNVFSSPLNPEMFAQLAAAGMLGSVPGASSSVPSSNPPPPCPRPSFPSLDTRDSRQDHSPFASPSHPYQRPEHLPSSVPRTNGASHNGLSDGKHITNGGDISTHSRQGSTGKSFIKKKKIASLSYRRTCQDQPSRQHTFRLPTRLLVTIVIPIPLLADQMLACPRRYGCLRLQHPHRHPASNRTHRSML
jgi:hypothetical protein